MWILVLIGLGVITGLAQLALAGFPSETAIIMHTLLLHQFAVTHGLLAVIGFFTNVITPRQTAEKLGWATSPYSYAGNNPVNLYDPAGLHPITAEELDAYRKANSPKWGTALAIIAGVGLAFVPGAQGLAAALITGAVLGGGASLIDQACSGYPIDWKQVGLSTVLGAAGGGLGYGAGKAFEWAARTPLGQRAIGWTMDRVNRIPVVRSIAQRLGPNGKPSNPDYTNLASPQRTTHILDGNGPGSGGHRWPGAPGKTPFPRDWSDARIMHEVSDIATDPAARWTQQTGPAGASTTNSGVPVKFASEATRDGVPIRVITQPGGSGIITGFPTQWPSLRATPAEIAARNEFSLATSSRRGN